MYTLCLGEKRATAMAELMFCRMPAHIHIVAAMHLVENSCKPWWCFGTEAKPAAKPAQSASGGEPPMEHNKQPGQIVPPF